MVLDDHAKVVVAYGLVAAQSDDVMVVDVHSVVDEQMAVVACDLVVVLGDHVKVVVAYGLAAAQSDDVMAVDVHSVVDE